MPNKRTQEELAEAIANLPKVDRVDTSETERIMQEISRADQVHVVFKSGFLDAMEAMNGRR